MDETIITNPNEIILVKINKVQGFYAYIVDIVADIKPDWWQIKMCPLVITSDFKLPEITWKLDSQHIRGSEFTMKGVPHQLFKVDFPKNLIILLMIMLLSKIMFLKIHQKIQIKIKKKFHHILN